MKALIVIDIQNGLTKKALYREEIFIETVNSAIKVFRNSGDKIVFVQHNSNQLQPNTRDWELDPRIEKQEDDTVIQKKHGNAFQDTGLKTLLDNLGIQSVTIGGLVSHGCVKATCLGALAAGFEVSLLKNGHTNWNQDALVKIEQTERELMEKVSLYTI